MYHFQIKAHNGYRLTHVFNSRNLVTPMFTSSKLKAIMPLLHQAGGDLVQYMTRKISTDVNQQIDCKEVYQRFAIEILGTLGCGIKPQVLESGNNMFYDQVR